ncbi:MAG: hypothetical protein KAI71_05905 [Candidatus Pacebacteria bacterium]|nr:hypothetical protein [Candidatus Paceibacterota bacterium]
MKYIDLINETEDPIFSIQDLALMGIKIYPYQLSLWSQKKYIQKLKNGLYVISERAKNLKMETIAFNLYQPSYISLEWALFKYGLIPEIVFNPTSVTAKTTRTFKNNFGLFSYRHLKKELFFGYRKISENNQVYLIAEPEKALLDYLYLNSPKIKTAEDIEELRFNEIEIKKLNKEKLRKYTKMANNKNLQKLIHNIANVNF